MKKSTYDITSMKIANSSKPSEKIMSIEEWIAPILQLASLKFD